MLVSCCSVVFSTFATAYTTNDGTNPKYGVYTYNFRDDATGNSAYHVTATGANINNTSHNDHQTFSQSNCIFASGKNQGQYKSFVDASGMHMTTEYASVMSATSGQWAARAFVRDPDSAISRSNDYNKNCFLAIDADDSATYTFVLKYRIEDLDPDDDSVNAAGVRIGLGFLTQNINESTSLSGKLGSSGMIKMLSANSYVTGLNPTTADVDENGNPIWKYLTCTVNSKDLTFTGTFENLINKYIVIVGGSNDKVPVKFHIESLTVAVIDSEYYGVYAPVDKTTTDGSLTENMEITTQNVEKIDFTSADSIAQYTGSSHSLLACSGGTTTNLASARDKSFVDETGLNLATYFKSGTDTSTVDRQRAFVKSSKSAFSKNNFVAFNGDLAATYVLTLKYKLTTLDADENGTNSVGAALGLSFWNPPATSSLTEASLNQKSGAVGISSGLPSGFTSLITSVQDEWQYLTVTVDFTQFALTKKDNGIDNYYLMIYARSESSDETIRFQIDSLVIMAIESSIVHDYALETDNDKKIVNENAKFVKKQPKSDVNTYEFDFEKFNSAKYKFATQLNKKLTDNRLGDFITGTDACSGIHATDSVLNPDGSMTFYPTGDGQRVAIYTGDSVFAYNAYNNAVFAKENTIYRLKATLSCDAISATKYTQVFFALTSSMKESTNGYYGWTGYNTAPLGTAHGIKVEVGTKVENVTITIELDTSVKTSAVGGAFALGIQADVTSGVAAPVTVSNVVIEEISKSAVIIEEYDGTYSENYKLYSATAYKGMTLPRPADKNGKYGSHWVNADGVVVTSFPTTAGIYKLYPVYKNHTVDFDSGKGYYDPNNKFPGKWSASAQISVDPLGEQGKTLHFYNYMWKEKTVNGATKYYWSGTNAANVSMTDDPTGDTGIKIKPDTTYKISFKYYVKSLSDACAKNDTYINIYQCASNGIGQDYNKILLQNGHGLLYFHEITVGWVDATIEFKTSSAADTELYPYIDFMIVGGQDISSNLYDSKEDSEALEEADELLTNIYFDDFNIYEAVVENTVEESYSSIRPEDAENGITAGLRVSAAISEDVAKAAKEIGFIALPTAKATANWYKFDENGKLADKVVSVKVKDIANGLLNTTGEQLKDSEGNKITELTAPKDVPAITGCTSYQLIITGLQKVGVKKAGLRNDAISVVLYTMDENGNYTYYFVNDVSYDMTVTKMAKAGDYYADCLYVVE